jgi:hypothetical protein
MYKTGIMISFKNDLKFLYCVYVYDCDLSWKAQSGSVKRAAGASISPRCSGWENGVHSGLQPSKDWSLNTCERIRTDSGQAKGAFPPKVRVECSFWAEPVTEFALLPRPQDTLVVPFDKRHPLCTYKGCPLELSQLWSHSAGGLFWGQHRMKSPLFSFEKALRWNRPVSATMKQWRRPWRCSRGQCFF